MIDSDALASMQFPGRDELPTIQHRTAYLLGLMLEQAPAMARPVMRSMLLPKLEGLDSESLTGTLEQLRDVVLPWLITGDTGGATIDGSSLPDQGERAMSVRGEDGQREDDVS